MRAVVKVADDPALNRHADQHHEQGAGDDGDDERAGIGVGDPASVAAEHEHRAVREVQHAERAVDDGEARGDQREKRSQHQSVETLRYEIRPVDHGAVRGFSLRMMVDPANALHPRRRPLAETTSEPSSPREARPERGPLRVADAERAHDGGQV